MPDTGAIGIVGASVLLDGEFVYAYAVREPGDHAVLLLRWSRADFVRGDLMQPVWFAGEERGFAAARPGRRVSRAGATEFSIAPRPRGGYVQVQSRGFGAGADRAAHRAAASPGRSGRSRTCTCPTKLARPGVLLYAARAHPELRGAELVVTYASNTLDPNALLTDLDLYFPRFVRLTWR